jgi:signal transduction histidine kinase
VNVLKTQNLTSEEKIQLYWDITIAYRYSDLDKAISYANKGLSLSEKEQKNLWNARFSRILGFTYINKSEHDSSRLNLENAITFAIKANDKLEENLAMTYMGSLYLHQGKYEEALKYFIDALPVLTDLQENEHYAVTLLNIAHTYRSLRNNEKALEYCEQAYKVAEKNNLLYTKMCSFEMKGSIYFSKQQYDSAAVILSETYEIGHQLNDKPRLATSTQMLVKTYCCLGEYDKAEKYANECLEIANELGHYALLMAWNSMSFLRFEQKRYEESAIYAYKMWETDSTDLFWARTTSHYLCNINMFLNNPEKAYYFLEKYADIRDQISDKELYDSMTNMEVKYETEKKEIRIASLEEERKLHLGLGIALVAVFLLGIGVLVYRHRLTTQKKKLAEQQIIQLEQEKELIAAHSALEAEKTEREIIARDLHDGVGAMLSVVKNNMNIVKSYSIIENTEINHFNSALDMLDKSIAELRRVAHHIMPATLIEKGLAVALDDFCRSIPEAAFHANTPSGFRFDSEKELVLYRCTYELVNNALRHAQASHIEVHLNADEKTIYLSVVDNGCGFDSQTASMGMGINNMRTRLSIFSGCIDIHSGQGEGTEVNIELNL